MIVRRKIFLIGLHGRDGLTEEMDGYGVDVVVVMMRGDAEGGLLLYLIVALFDSDNTLL